MGSLLIEPREIVLPGDIVAEGMDYIPGKGTYRKDEKVLAMQVGLLSTEGRVLKVIPLAGKYAPKVGDTIIGKVTNILMSGWVIDTNSVYHGLLSLKDGTDTFVPKGANLTKYYNIGDYVVCKIINITSQMLIDLSTKGSNIKKLSEGRITNVTSTKVPRIIGKSGSMINLIKDKTGSKIIVGQNGVVWLKNQDPVLEVLTVKALQFIEDNAHVRGLTDVVAKYLDEQISQLNK